jgi:hypothetical protein
VVEKKEERTLYIGERLQNRKATGEKAFREESYRREVIIRHQ